MKRKTIALVLAAVLVMGVSFVLVACNGDNPGSSETPKAPKGVEGISTGQNVSGGVTFTNYQITISDDTDWNSLSQTEMETIIDYAFDEVHRLTAENNVRYYNIIGVSRATGVCFIFDRETDEMVYYKNGGTAGRIPDPNL